MSANVGTFPCTTVIPSQPAGTGTKAGFFFSSQSNEPAEGEDDPPGNGLEYGAGLLSVGFQGSDPLTQVANGAGCHRAGSVTSNQSGESCWDDRISSLQYDSAQSVVAEGQNIQTLFQKRYSINTVGAATGKIGDQGFLAIGGKQTISEAGGVLVEDGSPGVVSGFALQPLVVLFAVNLLNTYGSGDGGYLSFGAVDRDDNQWCVNDYAPFLLTSRRSAFTNGMVLEVDGGYSFTATIDADGFTVTSVGTSPVGILVNYLMIGSPAATAGGAVGVETGASNGSSQVISGLDFAPECVISGSASETEGTPDTSLGWMALGAGAKNGSMYSTWFSMAAFGSRRGSETAFHAVRRTPQYEFELVPDSWNNDGFEVHQEDGAVSYPWGWVAIATEPDRRGALPVLGVG